MIEPFRAPAEPAWIGDLACAIALLVLVFFLHLSHALKLHERDTWWASNVRDAVNALAVVTIFGALSLQGFGLQLALLLAATLTLGLTVLHDSLAFRLRHPAYVVLAVAVVVAVPLFAAPEEVAFAVSRALSWAFGGPVAE